MIELCKLASFHAVGPLTVKFPKAGLLAIAFTDPWLMRALSMYFSCDGIFTFPATYLSLTLKLTLLQLQSPAHRNSLRSLAVFPEHNTALPRILILLPFQHFSLPGYLLGAKCPFNTTLHQTHLLPSHWKTHSIGGTLGEISSTGLNLVQKSNMSLASGCNDKARI